MSSEPGASARPEGVSGSAFPGPFPVGSYAVMLRDELRKRARVQLFGEVFNVSASRARVYFELRDGEGAVPCAMWRLNTRSICRSSSRSIACCTKDYNHAMPCAN